MNDLNLKGCKFSADIVPYMYGELAAADTLAFESHLLECSDCTDESTIGRSSSSITCRRRCSSSLRM